MERKSVLKIEIKWQKETKKVNDSEMYFKLMNSDLSHCCCVTK